MLSWTKTREPAQQTWPWLNKMPSWRPSKARSQSQSSKKILALLPPSSKVEGMSLSAAALATSRPTSVEPVKASFRKPGWSSIYWPARPPPPVTTFSTPGGSR